jgi:basic amino acid/polyamine antiporter, APA family
MAPYGDCQIDVRFSGECDTNSRVTSKDAKGLVRAIGRWSLAALVINSIIGSGIFGLPSTMAGFLGIYSPLAVLLAGVSVAPIVACYAEVSSYFTEAGGPYLWTRTAFGPLIGLETGWLLWLVRLTAPAANANLFVSYLGEFWPPAREPFPRAIVLTVLLGVLALINYRGVRAGTQVSNVFTIAKLLPLLIVIVGGMMYALSGHQAVFTMSPPSHAKLWLQAILLFVFAYGGFEGALVVMAEARNPKRDAPFALFTALIICALVYTLIQWIVVHVLADPVHSDRPLADAARLLMGEGGAALVSLGALVSMYGYLSANMLAVPRITFAFAEKGDFPRIFAAVDPRFHTPYFSIAVFAVLTWLFALLGNFTWNVTLSAVARLFFYAFGCAALPVLRRKRPGAAWFHLPGGTVFVVLGILICIVLATRIDLSGSLILGATMLAASVNWLLVRKRNTEKTLTAS